MKDRNGKTCLFLNKITENDFGYYTCLAKNEHGEEKKTIKIVKAGKLLQDEFETKFKIEFNNLNFCRGTEIH